MCGDISFCVEHKYMVHSGVGDHIDGLVFCQGDCHTLSFCGKYFLADAGFRIQIWREHSSQMALYGHRFHFKCGICRQDAHILFPQQESGSAARGGYGCLGILVVHG